MKKSLFLSLLISSCICISTPHAFIDQFDPVSSPEDPSAANEGSDDSRQGGYDALREKVNNDQDGSHPEERSFHQPRRERPGRRRHEEKSTPPYSDEDSNPSNTAHVLNKENAFLAHMTLDERARYWHMQEEKLKQAEDHSLSEHPINFEGWYLGLGIGYAHNNASTTTATYSGSAAQGALSIGYGKVWDKHLKNKIYGGGELHLIYNSVRMWNAPFKLRGGLGGGILGRMGIILHKKFMPYFLLGLDYDSYKLYQPTLKNFNSLAIVPGLGMEYLFNKSFAARMEFKYSFSTAIGGVSNVLLVKKPRKSLIQMGATLRF